MIEPKTLILPVSEVPDDIEWLSAQPGPVIAYGEGEIQGADVVVPDLEAAQMLEKRVHDWPISATTLVQVLRSTTLLPPQQALDLESLAYATLQAGPEFAAWLQQRGDAAIASADEGEAVLLSREGNVLEAVLNRASDRNPINVEMRDALVDALSVLEADESIVEFRLRGKGACFSIGGDLREFGTLPSPGFAHWVRTVQSPARLLATLGSRVTAYVHGACIGSGLELPAFAARVVAHRNTFFQMPELHLGLIPGAGGTLSITKRIGRQRLAWLVLSGRRINSRTALAWGLVDEVVH